MYNINMVTIEHINHLKDLQLSQVLHTLLTSEAEKHGLEDYEQSVPFNITTGDGGSDGRLEWTGKPDRTNSSSPGNGSNWLGGSDRRARAPHGGGRVGPS